DLDGNVTDVNMGLSGTFSLFGLGIQVPNSNPLTLQYHANKDEYLISGTISVPKLFNATVELGTYSQPSLKIVDGRFSVDAFSLSLSDVPLGGFTLRKLIVAYSQTTTATTFDVTVGVEFPQRWEVDGHIVLVNGDIHEISLKWQADSPSARIAIGDTGM